MRLEGVFPSYVVGKSKVFQEDVPQPDKQHKKMQGVEPRNTFE